MKTLHRCCLALFYIETFPRVTSQVTCYEYLSSSFFLSLFFCYLYMSRCSGTFPRVTSRVSRCEYLSTSLFIVIMICCLVFEAFLFALTPLFCADCCCLLNVCFWPMYASKCCFVSVCVARTSHPIKHGFVKLLETSILTFSTWKR